MRDGADGPGGEAVPWTVCRVCRRVLGAWIDPAGAVIGWEHPADTASAPGWVPHPPDPVPAAAVHGEVVGVCDFCSAPAPAWEYPARPFTLDGWASADSWAACEACHVLVEGAAWDELADRALNSGRYVPVPAALRRQVRARVRVMCRRFGAHRCGPGRELR